MNDLDKLLDRLAQKEQTLYQTQFLAPCIGKGFVSTSIDSIVYQFQIKPRNFAGWGIFKPVNNKIAKLLEEANLPQIMQYLQLFKPLRLRLIFNLQKQTWLAYPNNESDMQQRFGTVKPVPVHLVTEANSFETVIARFDGSCWWFQEIDRRSDLQLTTKLKEQLKQHIPTQSVRFAGVTPEMLTVYDLLWQKAETERLQIQLKIQAESGETRLKNALKQGGGELDDFQDRGDYWHVQWQTKNKDRHVSAISKKDLTVISSGICLSGRDRDFDLQSLVGVIEQREEDW